MFAIMYEESIAAGTRRIEAKTGTAAYELLKQKEIALESVQQSLKAGSYKEISTRLKSLQEEVASLKKQNAELTQEVSNFKSKEIVNEFVEINNKHVLLKQVKGLDKDMFSKLFDSLKVVHESSIVVLANVMEERIQLIAYVSSLVVQRPLESSLRMYPFSYLMLILISHLFF